MTGKRVNMTGGRGPKSRPSPSELARLRRLATARAELLAAEARDDTIDEDARADPSQGVDDEAAGR